jgi:hypothetical protein
VGSFPGFRMGSTRACFHTGGKYCLSGTALNTFLRKVIARFGRCLRTLFGIPFGRGALPTLSPLMALMTFRVWLRSVHFRAPTHMSASPHRPSL